MICVEELSIAMCEDSEGVALEVCGADVRPYAHVRGLHRGPAGGEHPVTTQEVTVDAADPRPAAGADRAQGEWPHAAELFDQSLSCSRPVWPDDRPQMIACTFARSCQHLLQAGDVLRLLIHSVSLPRCSSPKLQPAARRHAGLPGHGRAPR